MKLNVVELVKYLSAWKDESVEVQIIVGPIDDNLVEGDLLVIHDNRSVSYSPFTNTITILADQLPE